jgi:hypothetical protein
VASRTQIVCICEGRKGGSIDEVFINRLMKSLQPEWLRPWQGSNVIRLVPCGGRKEVVEKLPAELERCLGAGGHTTLMVWADCDDGCADPEALKAHFWNEAQRQAITKESFEQAVFVFAKDRIENWIEFLVTGKTDESKEGPRVKNNRQAAEAAKKLAMICREGKPVHNMPPSLQWSCKNWQMLRNRMQKT